MDLVRIGERVGKTVYIVAFLTFTSFLLIFLLVNVEWVRRLVILLLLAITGLPWSSSDVLRLTALLLWFGHSNPFNVEIAIDLQLFASIRAGMLPSRPVTMSNWFHILFSLFDVTFDHSYASPVAWRTAIPTVVQEFACRHMSVSFFFV